VPRHIKFTGVRPGDPLSPAIYGEDVVIEITDPLEAIQIIEVLGPWVLQNYRQDAVTSLRMSARSLSASDSKTTDRWKSSLRNGLNRVLSWKKSFTK